MSSQSLPDPTEGAAPWEPGPDTRVFSGPSLAVAIAAARAEFGRAVEIRSARKIRQGIRARTRFEVLATIPTNRATDAAPGSPVVVSPVPAPRMPTQRQPLLLPPQADAGEAVAATLAAMLADADDREDGGGRQVDPAPSAPRDFAADLAREITARANDPAFRAAMPMPAPADSHAPVQPGPVADETPSSQQQTAPAAATTSPELDPAPDAAFNARVREALQRVTIEPDPSIGDGPHPGLDMLDAENPGGVTQGSAASGLQETRFPRWRPSDSPRGLPDLATAGAPPGSLPRSAPTPLAGAESGSSVQPWNARALDAPSDQAPGRLSGRSRQEQVAARPEVSKRVFRSDRPIGADADSVAVSPAAADEIPDAATQEGTESVAAWNRRKLAQIGVPKEVLNRLPALDPTDDLGWLRALRVAIEGILSESATTADADGTDVAAIVNGTGAASAVIILRAVVHGATPGTLTIDGRKVRASATELALAVRSCVVC